MDDGICHVKIGASLSHGEHLHLSASYNRFESICSTESWNVWVIYTPSWTMFDGKMVFSLVLD